MEVKDSNWNVLVAGDSIVLIKDIPIKGWKPLKRWSKVKNIRIYSEEEIEGKIDGIQMVIKTMYVKKN